MVQFFLSPVCHSIVKCFRQFKPLYFLSKFSYCKIMDSKPLNILVLTENNCKKLFNNIKGNIYKCVSPSHYVVYQILDSELLTQPWIESTSLVVIASKELTDAETKYLEKYISQSGKVFLVCSKFKSLAGFRCLCQPPDSETPVKVKILEVGDIPLIRGIYAYISTSSEILFKDSLNKPVIQKICDQGIFIASEIYIDRDPNFLPTNLLSMDYNDENRLLILKRIFTENFGLMVKYETAVEDLSSGYYVADHVSLEKSMHKIPIFHKCLVKYEGKETEINIYYYNKNENSISFDTDLYFSSLNTHEYGHKLVHFSSITSTMDIAEQLSDYNGIVILADIQTAGRGRHDNKWISSLGCAMFTLCISIDLVSNLGQKLSLMQHMAALAVVHGIRNNKQYKDLNIKIKWPNDIYYESYKIAGLLVTSSVQGKTAQVKIGWGINVTNSSPSVCLNDVIAKYNVKNSCNLPYLRREEVMACTLSHMEYFIKDFQNSSPDNIFRNYYSYWMHGNQEVNIQNLNETGIVSGIDEYGFLLVKTSKGEVSLHPNGNRFDLMKNLIYPTKQ